MAEPRNVVVEKVRDVQPGIVHDETCCGAGAINGRCAKQPVYHGEPEKPVVKPLPVKAATLGAKPLGSPAPAIHVPDQPAPVKVVPAKPTPAPAAPVVHHKPKES